MKKLFSVLAILLSLAVLLTACGGGGGGSSSNNNTGGGGTATTTISGKVTLSSTVSKPSYKSVGNAPMGRPGSKLYLSSMPATGVDKSLMASAVPLDSATVYLFNADHPEWLAPVAETTADDQGNYTFTVLKNSAKNHASYTDGAAIPVGKYTLVAFKFQLGQKPLVATQTIVNKFEGAVTGTDLVAQPSDAAPTIRAMFGYGKNTDGTQTWGNSSAIFPTNAAIQISFSMAMWRDNLKGISISPAVSGHWTLSSDWTTATFYPDQGVTLQPSTTYTITVPGADTATIAVPAVTNVYGNALALTAVGTFTTAAAADTTKPTTTWLSPSLSEMASPVDVTKPIRIGSNKVLDVNGLLLESTSAVSLGAKPGVLYVGQDGNNLYVYEFQLGQPLKLGTTYDLKVSGGKDLAGNVMNDLAGSLTTVSAGLSTGITATADTTTQNAQASVKDVFGKWVRGFNDKNVAAIQSLMSGDFYMEYDVSQGIDDEADINRDGRYSMKEFSDMLSKRAFSQWQYCGTTISGDIVGVINVVGNNADFEFKLTASSTLASQDCSEGAPKESLYATLQNINGAWTIVRASEGIDNRTRPIVNPAKAIITLSESGNPVANGGQLSTAVTNTISPSVVTFSWNAVNNVSTYVLILVDARNPRRGIAFAVPSTMTSISTNTDPKTAGAVNVSSKFGFDQQGDGGSSAPSGGTSGGGNGPFVQGGQYYWEVIGLGSIGLNSIGLDTTKDSDIIADISAISNVNNFNVAGVYKEMTVAVTAGSTPLTYDERFRGYDAGSAGTVAITVHTMNPDSATNSGCASLNVQGSSSQSYPLTFTNGSTTVNAQLFQGWNGIYIQDCAGLNKDFSVQTKGGILPVIQVSSIVDDHGHTLTSSGGYGSPYYNDKNSASFVSGSKKLTFTGTVGAVNGGTIPSLNVNVWNDSIKANYYAQTPVAYTNGTGSFSVTVEIYNGNNWISFDGSVSTGTSGPGPSSPDSWYNANLGVYTDTGSVYVPPFGNVTVWSSLTTTLASTNNYGNSADWDASGVASNSVTITGKLKNPTDGKYWINSDGNNSNGTLKVLADGTFSLTVDLYNGWNNVGMNDATGNWYGANIHTSAGKPVYKTVISKINGNTYIPPTTGGMGTASVTQCYATIVGQALVGQVQINWNGYDGTTTHNEWQSVQSTGTAGTLGNFSATVPLVSGTGSYNYIDINDANWKWTGLSVTTSGNCPYTTPTVTATTVKDASGNVLTADMSNNYNAGTSTKISITGTTNRPGLTINAFVNVCGLNQNYSATAALTADGNGLFDWTISNVAVYDTTNMGSNWININGGNNFQNNGFGVNSTNGQKPTSPIQITSLTYGSGTVVSPNAQQYGCGFTNYDATLAATAATQITIVGHSNAGAGTGNYVDATGQSHQFTIDNSGNFTLLNIPVYDGNNNININDANWNFSGVGIQTANLIKKPQIVTITSPNNGATGLTGPKTVTGTIATSYVVDGTTYTFNPDRVTANVSMPDPVTGIFSNMNYSSDLKDQQNLDDLPITLKQDTSDPSLIDFSFTVDFGTPGTQNMPININIWANDNMTWTNHADSISVNSQYAGPENYYKARKAVSPSANPYQQQQALKLRLMTTGQDR